MRDKATSGQPAWPRSLVQLGTAVSRNPAIAATTNPNTISWPCHSCGGMPGKGVTTLTRTTIHAAIAMAPYAIAARKKGRKP
jgi:hypothetical protein